jgi:hypothetical protein
MFLRPMLLNLGKYKIRPGKWPRKGPERDIGKVKKELECSAQAQEESLRLVRCREDQIDDFLRNQGKRRQLKSAFQQITRDYRAKPLHCQNIKNLNRKI